MVPLYPSAHVIHDPLRVLYRAGSWLDLRSAAAWERWMGGDEWGEWRGELSFLAFEVARPAASGLRSLRTVFRVDRPSRSNVGERSLVRSTV